MLNLSLNDVQDDSLNPFDVKPERHLFRVKLESKLSEQAKSKKTPDDKEKVINFIISSAKDETTGFVYTFKAPSPMVTGKKLVSLQGLLLKRLLHLYLVATGRTDEDRPAMPSDLPDWETLITQWSELFAGTRGHDWKPIKNDAKTQAVSVFAGKTFFSIVQRQKGALHRNDWRLVGAVIEAFEEGKHPSLQRGDAKYEFYDQNSAAGATPQIGLQAAPGANPIAGAGGASWDQEW